jgi:chromosome segregation ATPase
MEEARTRFLEVNQFKQNELTKYRSIESDFSHQNQLMAKISSEKIKDLDTKIAERKNKIDNLNGTLEQMKQEHEKRLEEKNEMFKEIKVQMETLSNEFSKQLSDIQRELKEQTEKVSQKWEHNPSDHIKSFEKEVQKYDITKASN